MITRRSLLRAIPALIAAPAIVRVASIMPVRVVPFEFETAQIYPLYGRSPAMDALVDMDELIRRMIHVYAVPDYMLKAPYALRLR